MADDLLRDRILDRFADIAPHMPCAVFKGIGFLCNPGGYSIVLDERDAALKQRSLQLLQHDNGDLPEIILG